MSSITETMEKSNQSKNIITYSIIGIVFLIALWLSSQSEGPSKFPKFVTDEFTFTAWVNEGEDFLKKNYRWMTKIVAGYIKACYYFVEDFLLESPWLLIAAIFFLPCIISHRSGCFVCCSGSSLSVPCYSISEVWMLFVI